MVAPIVSTAASAPATITVTYQPDLAMLARQLRALPDDCIKVIVDNASAADLVSGIRGLVAELAHVVLICNSTNLGLAAAVNCGVGAVSKLPTVPRFVLLLDQDSEPYVGSVETLMSAFGKLESDGHRVGCVGPSLLDPSTGLAHGFHQCTRWRWRRVYPMPGSKAPVACANLNGSGTLVPVALFQRLGGLDEALFIDHVDTEWAFRVTAAGYTLWGIPNAVFNHHMGQSSRRMWFLGWRIWPARSPDRHYYLYRNAVLLMRRPYVPRVWKVWAVLKLLVTTLIVAFIGPSRALQMCRMAMGVKMALNTKLKNIT